MSAFERTSKWHLVLYCMVYRRRRVRLVKFASSSSQHGLTMACLNTRLHCCCSCAESSSWDLHTPPDRPSYTAGAACDILHSHVLCAFRLMACNRWLAVVHRLLRQWPSETPVCIVSSAIATHTHTHTHLITVRSWLAVCVNYSAIAIFTAKSHWLIALNCI